MTQIQKNDVQLSHTDGNAAFQLLEDKSGKRFVDIRTLGKHTGFRTFDPGLVNTATCKSTVSFVNGEEGKLFYRGYAIEDLCEYCTFIEVAYLLILGKLPTAEDLKALSEILNKNSMLHEDMRIFFNGYPEHSHPMAILSAMVVSLSSFYPELAQEEGQQFDMSTIGLLSRLRTIAAFSYKKSTGEPFVYPSRRLDYCSNFLNMMFSGPVSDYEIDPVVVRALNRLLILHGDHGQNCSTSTLRLVGSAGANLYACVAAAICALWGPNHGGANQRVVEMLQQIHDENLNINSLLDKAKDRSSGFKLMGFGHRVYKAYDPRARIAKSLCHELLQYLNYQDPLMDIALELEEKALAHPYFQDRSLYPNVDFYTGITYRAMGFPTNMYTVLFSIGRLPGWIAQWHELMQDPELKIGRPGQMYVGEIDKPFIRIDRRY